MFSRVPRNLTSTPFENEVMTAHQGNFGFHGRRRLRPFSACFQNEMVLTCLNELKRAMLSANFFGWWIIQIFLVLFVSQLSAVFVSFGAKWIIYN